MRDVPQHYVSGGAYGTCMVCGFKTRLNKMRLRWDNLRVCELDWDAEPAQLKPPVVTAEGLPRPDASPEPPDTFVGVVRPSDL